MNKNISIGEDVYEELKKLKGKYKSFSEVLREIIHAKGGQTAFSEEEVVENV